MATPPRPPARPLAPPPGGDGGGAADDTADELRRLVLGPDRAELLDRWARAGPEHLDAAALGDLLPEAVRLREARDDELGRALEPSVEAGLRASVERNPQPLADILFPVMGPAIRRAVRQAVASSLDSLNRSVNYGLSWRGLRWRLEAWRSGVSFGEVVLRHTLRYRVEQVLLVHRKTGLPLWHVVAPEVAGDDNADLVSAMLTALRQFVGDSFDVSEDESLDAFQAGDLTVWAEAGPAALLAVVVRGTPPASLRERMCEALEAIHAKLASAFDVFEGDTAPFETADEILEPLLDAEYAEEASAGRAKLWVLGLLVLGLAGWLAWRVWDARQREAAFLQALDAEPGITVLRTEHEDGRLVVLGAADPLAPDPLTLVPDDLDPEDLDLRLVTALSDDLLAQRAASVLDVPEGVALRSEGGRLLAEGEGDTLWAPEARRLLPLLGGRALDLSGLRSPIQSAAEAVESHVIRFEEGSAAPAAIDALRDDVARLARVAASADPPVVVVVEGHTDDVGTEAENQRLSLNRALAVRAALLPAAEGLTLRAEGHGAGEAVEAGPSARSRRVVLRVEREAPAPPRP